jgi:hypothetical protein
MKGAYMNNAPTPIMQLHLYYLLGKRPLLSFHRAGKESFGSPLVFTCGVLPEPLLKLRRFMFDFINGRAPGSLAVSSGNTEIALSATSSDLTVTGTQDGKKLTATFDRGTYWWMCQTVMLSGAESMQEVPDFLKDNPLVKSAAESGS